MKTPVEYIKLALQTYVQKEKFFFYAKIMAVLTIVSTSLGLLMRYLYPVDVFESLDFSNTVYAAGFIALSLVTILFGVYVRSTTMALVTSIDLDVKYVFERGFKKYLVYLFASSMVGLIVALGLVLLIVPGIIFGVWFSFTLLLIFDKGLGIKEAFKESKAMVAGRFWKVLGRFVVFGVFGILVTLGVGYIPYAGSILVNFMAPLFLLPVYLMYKDLKIL